MKTHLVFIGVFATSLAVAQDPWPSAEHPVKDARQKEMHEEIERHHVDENMMTFKAFSGFDKNQDGVLLKSEIPANHPMFEHFPKMDTNGDGRLTRDEFLTRHPVR
jgi:hypothetical protein